MLRIRSEQGEADPAGLLRESLGQAAERSSSVGRLVDAALVAEAAAGEGPRGPPPGVEGGVHDVRVRRIEDDVDASVVLVDLQDRLPGLAAVNRPIEPALLVRVPQVAHDRGVYDVGVLRMDGQAGDVARVVQAQVGEALAGVGRLVDPVSPAGRVAPVPLAAADVDDDRVRGRDRDTADRQGRLIVEDRLEGRAAVLRLEQPPGPGGDEELRRLPGDESDLAHPPPHVGGAYRSPGERADQLGGDRAGLARRGLRGLLGGRWFLLRGRAGRREERREAYRKREKGERDQRDNAGGTALGRRHRYPPGASKMQGAGGG